MQKFILEDIFLNSVRREKTEVSVFLLDRVIERGTIHGFDGEVIILNQIDSQKMIYKNSILYIKSDKFELAEKEQK